MSTYTRQNHDGSITVLTDTTDEFQAQQCPHCKEWIYTADGPFAEAEPEHGNFGDPTKPTACHDHIEECHPETIDPKELESGFIRIPYCKWNEEEVMAIYPKDALNFHQLTITNMKLEMGVY